MEPPCSTCRPEVLPENMVAFSVYSRLQGDWLRDAGGHLTGLPVQSIESVLRMMEVPRPERLPFLDEVLSIASVIIREVEKERQKESDAKTQN